MEDIKNRSCNQKILNFKIDMVEIGNGEVIIEIKEKEKEDINKIKKLKFEKDIFFLNSNLQSQSISGDFKNSDVSFRCSEVLRRDAFSHHFKNLHTEIQAWSDHWIDHRCPMASYGCTYSHNRLTPQGSSLLFDTNSLEFRVPPQLHSSSYNKASVYFSKHHDSSFDKIMPDHHEPTNTFNLFFLPQLLIDRIFNYLDPFTLRMMSLVSVRCRRMCESLVNRKGMVQLRWKKVIYLGSSMWKITSHVSFKIL